MNYASTSFLACFFYSWLITPLEDVPNECSEILPTPDYMIWIKAGKPQEPTVNLEWDGRRDDNPQYDSRLTKARAQLRRLLVEEKQRKQQMRKVRKETSEQARRLKELLDRGLVRV